MRSVVVLALLSFACGREDIELVPRDGSAFGDGGCEVPSTPRKCQGNGATCSVASECCSGRCADRVCLAPSCGAPASACTSRDACCSGRCDPFGAGGALVCLAYCAADGSPCTHAADCCGLSCNGGACGGAICRREGDACTSAAKCCSNLCGSDGKCALVESACRPAGESCKSGGGMPCCSGACTDSDRCDFGPGACSVPGQLCNLDGDCCRGTCVANGQGVRVCTAACLPSGGACASGADCCAGLTCSGTTRPPAAPPTARVTCSARAAAATPSAARRCAKAASAAPPARSCDSRADRTAAQRRGGRARQASCPRR